MLPNFPGSHNAPSTAILTNSSLARIGGRTCSGATDYFGLLLHGKTKVPGHLSGFFPWGKCPVYEWEMKVVTYHAGNSAFVPELLVLN